VGIFDLDWALPGARCRDVADGVYFFATAPRQIDSASIWSLTDAADFDLDRCAVFLRAYEKEARLDTHEIDAVPLAFAGRWISIRLEGMAKVPEQDRFRFFSRDVKGPLQWLDRHWEELRDLVW
jgi:Ser/Thr protein kinase RdoA (MazF antagonist)